jgi:hypothetical protein
MNREETEDSFHMLHGILLGFPEMSELHGIWGVFPPNSQSHSVNQPILAKLHLVSFCQRPVAWTVLNEQYPWRCFLDMAG